MRRPRNLLIAFVVLLVVAGLAAAQNRQSNRAVVGIWHGELGNLPAVTLNLTDEAGPLQGAILFYLMRQEAGKPPTSSPGVPEPLFHTRFNGKRLIFQVSHKRAHAYTASDPPVTFRLDLTGPDEARLVRIPQDGPAYLRMIRERP